MYMPGSVICLSIEVQFMQNKGFFQIFNHMFTVKLLLNFKKYHRKLTLTCYFKCTFNQVRTSGDICPGRMPGLDALACMFDRLRAMDSSELPLVRHLMASWRPAWWPSWNFLNHVLTQKDTSIGGPRTQDGVNVFFTNCFVLFLSTRNTLNFKLPPFELQLYDYLSRFNKYTIYEVDIFM